MKYYYNLKQLLYLNILVIPGKAEFLAAIRL